MDKTEIINVLRNHGYTNIQEKRGGVEVTAERRTASYEFDSSDFVRIFAGRMDLKSIHMLDSWTVSIECE